MSKRHRKRTGLNKEDWVKIQNQAHKSFQKPSLKITYPEGLKPNKELPFISTVKTGSKSSRLHRTSGAKLRKKEEFLKRNPSNSSIPKRINFTTDSQGRNVIKRLIDNLEKHWKEITEIK